MVLSRVERRELARFAFWSGPKREPARRGFDGRGPARRGRIPQGQAARKCDGCDGGCGGCGGGCGGCGGGCTTVCGSCVGCVP